MSIKENLLALKATLPADVTLVAVSKTKPAEAIKECYDAGHRIFGENKVQELASKYEDLPKDIEWHMIGHLQTNKVKYIAPFVSLIHSIDSEKLLKEVNKQAQKFNRIISCLIQVHIAEEETKYGFSIEEAKHFFNTDLVNSYPNIEIKGLMGMATFTDNQDQIAREFASLHNLYSELKNSCQLTTLSMGMSGDYEIAMVQGSNMIRVGSAIFGSR